MISTSQSQSLPWDVVEKAIKKEMDWLIEQMNNGDLKFLGG